MIIVGLILTIGVVAILAAVMITTKPTIEPSDWE
jgi:hypothetical protein